jgi:hypothetical protein
MEASRGVIDIGQVADPVDGPFVPTLADLDGISFRVRPDKGIDLAGRALAERVEATNLGDATVLPIVARTAPIGSKLGLPS